jgi:GTP cyclohydrolase II
VDTSYSTAETFLQSDDGLAHQCYDATRSRLMEEVRRRLNSASQHDNERERAFVTVAYAQSLDGSIASLPGHPLELSGVYSTSLAHSLRAVHDGICVGIGTILSDDPRLTVRMAPGPDPQPVVLDSRLRFPLNAKLLNNGCIRRPWIATSENADPSREHELRERGVSIIRVAPEPNGQVRLNTLLCLLKQSGIATLLVEGGAQVITSFLAARLVDQLVVTIAPLLVGGLRAPDGLSRSNGVSYPRLLNLCYERAGEDLVLRGDPSWGGGT